MKTHILSVNEQYLINRIAKRSVQINPSLDFTKSYIITLFHYLTQYSNYKMDTIPDEYIKEVKALYKKPESSYINYLSKIKDTNSKYVYAIKAAEIEEIGDDPLCPWC